MAFTPKLLQQGAGGGLAKNYIEDVFSTYLYTGNNSTNTINNNIDLAGKGGLVWIKGRVATAIVPTFNNILYDTTRGVNKILESNTTDAQDPSGFTGLTSFTSTGFVLGSASQTNIGFDASNIGEFVSWTFRKQKKFFDIVTYTGTGSTQTINHNLGSTPGCIMIKSTSMVQGWPVYHRSLGGTNKWLVLNGTNATVTSAAYFGTPTDSTFTVVSDNGTNGVGETYIAYLFAHNAGGFGESGNDNVISCGTFTTDAGGSFSVNLGYEPQWILVKQTDVGTQDWQMYDNMRGIATQPASVTARLMPNTDGIENPTTNDLGLTSTGFDSIDNFRTDATYIYIAIRRGPMKVPTVGTSVFSPIQATGSTGTKLTTNFPVDLQLWALTADGGSSKRVVDRLRAVSTNTTTRGTALFTDLPDVEDSASVSTRYFDNTGYTIPGNFLGSGYNAIYWNFRRAPGFFDIVTYTGNSTAGRTVTHNLGAVPELMFLKSRNGGNSWIVYTAPTGNSAALYLSSADALETAGGAGYFNNTTPTATQFTVGNYTSTNANRLVAYLFATLAGVSKVGSYTGTGTTLQVNCGFTSGARFVLIKRTNATGDWYVWDTTRGIVAGNDPYLFLNSAAAQVTSTDYIDTYSAGFELSSTAPAAINANGGNYIFLAIA